MEEVTAYPFLSEPTHEKNDDGYLIRIPFVEGEMACTAREEATQQFGFMSLHNKLGSNKSILLPLMADTLSSFLGVVTKDDPGSYDGWFGEAIRCSAPGPTKAIRNAYNELLMKAEDATLQRSYQVNVLAKLDDGIQIVNNGQSNPSAGTYPDRLSAFDYEILVGLHRKDGASWRNLVCMDRFKGNGHVVEALMTSTLCGYWGVKEFDLPYSLARQLRWLGAQYLRKQTRGNFFPQINPTIDDIAKSIEAGQMKCNNDEWGALAALTAVIGEGK